MDEQDSAGRPAGEERGRGLSPVQAFMMLMAVAVVVPLTILATRPGAAPTPGGPARTPDFSLTDAEAIARFESLHDMFRSASKNRDASLLKLMLTGDSRLHATARDQIRQLIADGVLDRSRFTHETVRVLANTSERITIEQIVVIRPRFVNEETERVVSAGSPLVQEVHWTLGMDGGVWKVHDSVVRESRRAG